MRIPMKKKTQRKPTSKDFQFAIQDLRMHHVKVQTQLNALTEVFSDYLDYTGKKEEFMQYVKDKVKNTPDPGSVENPEVVQEPLD